MPDTTDETTFHAKNVKCSDQPLECAAPKCWSKYTTITGKKYLTEICIEMNNLIVQMLQNLVELLKQRLKLKYLGILAETSLAK